MLIFESFANTLVTRCVLLRRLPGGFGRFIPGRIGANHGRLRHVGWDKNCHLGSLLGEGFLSDLVISPGYPNGSGAALLEGTLKLKYHTFPFARRKPNWRLTSPGHVVDILTTGGEDVFLVCMHISSMVIQKNHNNHNNHNNR